MTTFTPDTPWQDWVDYAHEKGPVDPDPSTCSVSVWSYSIDGTIADAVGAMAAAEDDQIRCAIWIVMHGLNEFPSSLVPSLLHIIATDSPRAAYIYEKRARDLSEPEKHILWDAFSENMPMMRDKLSREIGKPKDG